MTDDLERLRAALKTAPPAADASRKAADISAAMAAFDQETENPLQGSPAEPRPSNSRPMMGRLIDGGISMIHALTSRAGLAATTGLVTAGLAVLIVLPQDIGFGPNPDDAFPETRNESADMTVATVASDAPVERDLAEAVEPMLELASPSPAAPLVRQAARAKMAPAAGVALDSMALSDAPMAFGRAPQAELATEEFANDEAAGVTAVTDQPVSTFSVDVDTASWSVLRSSLMNGYLPPSDAIRIEEMVNYFPYAYPAPKPGGDPFEPTVNLSQTPWNPNTQILHIALQGEMPAVQDRPPLNLVFLIDTSGSMQDANKLPLLKQSLRLMLGELRPEDEVAMVAYAGSAGLVLEPTPAGEASKILAALDRLEAGGSTAGQEGLEQAYAIAADMAGEGELSRILLATDGDFNVGIHDPDALEDFIAAKRETGAYLSVLGFGRGNLDDATMQALAQAGNGQAAHIDTIAEAQKVLVDQLTGQLFPIAQDVKVQVEFNPAVVAEYRLIGYETRALRREDFANDKVDAGEIGAGHQVTALYEVTPVGSPAVLNEPLRYQPGAGTREASDELGFLRLRYKAPGESESHLIETAIPAGVSEASVETRFASAIAGFGQLLRGSVYTGEWNYADAIALANSARGEDAFGYRAEAVRLMRLAETLAAPR
ncbi:vWA domain-containing protein [Aliiruegeria lutimaris]|uniref:Ca-activated chloride channel family protein n=1 Tax=Aliiruegeria lutimaris TaxID=571298 RepID=A0A1G8QN10_9RHOB|nr:VWA domain-containing protein [Aliiruegeria lutimaris]SDJ06097.1 Ca-activated chloride channel family protein [Aliiruegeria lutimaris]